MAIESADDRQMLLADFGQNGSYGAGSATLRGIFDREYVETDSISGFFPVYACTTAQAQAVGVADGGVLILEEGGYIVRVPQHDGTGMTRLILEAQ